MYQFPPNFKHCLKADRTQRQHPHHYKEKLEIITIISKFHLSMFNLSAESQSPGIRIYLIFSDISK